MATHRIADNTGRVWKIQAATPEEALDFAHEQYPDLQFSVASSQEKPVEIPKPPSTAERPEEQSTAEPDSPVKQQFIPDPTDFIKTLLAPADNLRKSLDIQPTAEGSARMKDKSFMQKMGMIDQAISSQAKNMAAGFGYLNEATPWIREHIGDQATDTLLGPEGELDKQLADSHNIIGRGGDTAAQIAGSVASPLNRIMPSSFIGGEGVSPFLKRAGTSALEDMGTASGAATAHGEDAGAAAREALPTSAASILFEQLARTFGGKLAKGWGQRNLTETEKGIEDARPLVENMLEDAPKDVDTPPDSPLLYQVGTQGPATLRAGAPGNTEAFSKARSAAQQSRQQEYERSRVALGDPPRSATAADTALKEDRFTSLNPQYTPALQGKLPNTNSYSIERVSVDNSGKKTITKQKVSVPIVFSKELTANSSNYDAYMKALNGDNGGLAKARAHALDRGGGEPSQTEIAWETIKALKREGEGTAQYLLGKNLQDKLEEVNDPLKSLIKDTNVAHMKERATKQAKDVWKQPGKMDADLREAKSDPDVWKAFQDAFRGSALEHVSTGKLPDWTPQKRQSFVEVLGEPETARLEKHFREQMRRRTIEDPIRDYEPPPVATKTSKTGMMAGIGRAGGYALRGLAGGGGIGLLANMGPAAAQFLKNKPDMLSAREYRGLVDALLSNELPPARKLTLPEKAATSKTRVAAGVAAGQTQQDREKRRRSNRGQE